MNFIHFYKNRNNWICFLPAFLFIVICLSDVVAADPSKPKTRTVVNTHKDGGIIKKWLVLGPFPCFTRSNSSRKDSSLINNKPAPCFDHDYIHLLGGEKGAFIRKFSSIYYRDTRGKRKYVKAKEVAIDSNGIVTLDSLFAADVREIAYAFCMVESFIPCSVRCFWGVDGSAKAWINGKRMQNKWDHIDSCLPLSKYFDAEFIQGMNSVLLKFSDEKQHSRFTFEVYDLRDSLLPYWNSIHSLVLELSGHEIVRNTDSLNAILGFNIPVPEDVFKGTIHISKDNIKSLKKTPLISYQVGVGTPFKLAIPADLQGVVSINAVVEPGDNRRLKTTRYIWKGDFNASIDSQHVRFRQLAQKVRKSTNDNAFVNTIIQGAYQWGKDWFTYIDSLSIDEKIRQLGYIQSNGDLIESLLNGERVQGNISYPLFLSVDLEGEESTSSEYDPSQWLNYKYPDMYSLPRDVEGAVEYRFWLYLPADAGRKRKKMPLILSLHGAEGRGNDINRIKNFGMGGYAETVSDFPFAVVTPLCRYKTLWDAKVLKKLLDTLIATGRFNKKRIYVTGTGMGGFTAWHLACAYPKFFAAIVPINGGGDENKICNIKRVSVWAFHGAKDKIVPIEKSQDMITALKECGIQNVEFSIYAEYGHEISPIVYSDQRLYEWLKKQK